jgi:hypothetical protein
MKTGLARIFTTPLPSLAGALTDRARRKGNAAALRFFAWRVAGRRGRPDAAPLAAIDEKLAFFAFPEASDAGGFLSLLNEEFPLSLQAALARADSALKHRFEILGYGEIGIGTSIDWQHDFLSAGAGHADVKVPWELSRFYHFLPLGKAYLATGNEDYTREFLAELDDWAHQNPPFQGVNWTSPMEAAIRAVNWIWAYHFFRSSALFTDELKQRFADSLFVHGQYIARSLEFARRVVKGKLERENGNHYVADLVGLIYIGLFLTGREPRRWRETAIEELAAEMQIQVLSDGAHWELSPAYHRLVLEMCLSVLILCARNGIALPPVISEQTRAMLAFTAGSLNPGGTAPNVRDADEGRLYRLGESSYRDHRHTLVVGACHFRSAEWLDADTPYSEDALWLLGREGRDWFCESRRVRGRASLGFPEAGFYVLRSARDVQVFASCAGIGMRGREGGHAHNDCLSFELSVAGQGIIADSGTFVYGADPTARMLFRSTASHNTARVDGQEMNEISATALFHTEDNARPQVTRWETSVDFDLLVAEHFGYFRLPEPLVHGRQFLLDKKRDFLLVRDRFTGIGAHDLEIILNLDPGATAEVSGSEVVIKAGSSRVRARILDAGEWTLGTEQTWYSDGYGRRVPTQRVVCRARKRVPCFFTMAFLCSSDARRPADGQEERAEHRAAEHGRRQALGGQVQGGKGVRN